MLTKAASQRLQIAKGGTYSTAKDALKYQIWDTRLFTATPTDSSFFMQPIGSVFASTGSKTKNETNMTDSGKLPVGQTFLIERMGVICISAYDTLATGATSGWANSTLIVQSFINMLQTSTFEFVIAGRAFDFQIHGSQFLPSLSLNGLSATSFGSSTRVGDELASGWVKLEPSPIQLAQLVSFQLNQLTSIGNPTVVTGTQTHAYSWLNAFNCSLQIVLQGFLTRSK